RVLFRSARSIGPATTRGTDRGVAMEQTTFTPLLDVVAELTERCDRCGAAAKLTVAMTEGGLAFCGHHANAHVDSIVRVAVRIRVVADFAWPAVPYRPLWTVPRGRAARTGTLADLPDLGVLHGLLLSGSTQFRLRGGAGCDS